MTRSWLRRIGRAGVGGVVLTLIVGTTAWAQHINVRLRDHAGNILAPGSTAPYSPKQTCGGCHPQTDMTSGKNYHAEQGWDELFTPEQKAEKPWIQGPGMAGKW